VGAAGSFRETNSSVCVERTSMRDERSRSDRWGLFVSVEHTGTFHTAARAGLPLRSFEEARPGIPFTHLWDEQIEAILAYGATVPVLTTERPYADVRESWLRRGRDMKELEAQWRNYERLLRELKPDVLKLGRK
jgi:hypothetical protein